MSTDTFYPLPLEEYLQPGAGKARRALHKEAFSRRVEHWQFSVRATGLEEAEENVLKQLGAALDELQQAVDSAQLQRDIQLEVVLSFEEQLKFAQEECANSLAGQVLVTSCTLAEYELALYRAKKRLRQAQAILGDRQEPTEACYAELLAMDVVVQLRETVREQLELQRAKAAKAFSNCIGTTSSGKMRKEILAADLGEHEKSLLRALALHENFKKCASYQARLLAEALDAGQSAYQDEAPPSSRRFVAHGSYVRALDNQGNTVARWAVAADGGAYLLKVLQPTGTRRIRRRDQEIKAFGQHGQVLGSYPNTAWLMRRPQRSNSTSLAV